MNEVILKGKIRNIQKSHIIGDVEYDGAELIVRRPGKDDDIINLKFKKFSNPYKENDEIELVGNLRTYSYQLINGKNKVDLYCFTYFDLPNNYFEDIYNKIKIDGRICKLEDIQTTKSGKQFIRFILANNILSANKKFNAYIPCIAYGKTAQIISKLNINDIIECDGEIHSHTYKKITDTDVEFKIAQDVTILNVELKDEF